MKNLTVAFPQMEDKRRREIARSIYRHFGDFVSEWMAIISKPDLVEQRVSCTGMEHLESALKDEKGVMILSAHLGHWEILAAFLAARSGHPLTIIRHVLNNRVMDDWFTSVHRQLGFADIVKKRSTIEIFRRLKRNELIGMLVDQSGRGSGIWLPFFGRPTSFHRGPGFIAGKTDCQIVTAFCVPMPGRKWQIFIEPLEVAVNGDPEHDTHVVMSEYARRLEMVIRDHPDRYFWFHNRWKTKLPKHLRKDWPEL